MLSAILFDLDNTLIDRDKAFCLLVRATFGDDEDLLRSFVELDASGYGNRKQLFQTWHDKGGPSFNSASFGAAIAKFVPRNEALLRALAELQNKFLLGVITNGGASTQRAKWRASGLVDVIPGSRLWISGDIGVSKPSVEIFQHACCCLGLNASQCMYVGDQLDTDVRGAKAAGMRAMHATYPLTQDDIRDIGTRSTQA